MLKNLILVVTLVVIAAIASAFALRDDSIPSATTEKEESKMSASTFFSLNALDIEGNDVNLGKYKNKVVMFVNTASQCGFTPQYKGLQAIYDKYKDRGFVILGFPANNFGGQEPGSNEEIKTFCTMRYKVTFPMFAKISVKGDDQHPLYKHLTSHEKFGGDVSWNFNKFLANHKGELINRFDSRVKPESETIATAIEEALKALQSGKKKAAGE